MSVLTRSYRLTGIVLAAWRSALSMSSVTDELNARMQPRLPHETTAMLHVFDEQGELRGQWVAGQDGQLRAIWREVRYAAGPAAAVIADDPA